MSTEEKKTINIYLVGNTGVGKTHLVNCLLNENKWKSAESSTSVTHELESITSESEDTKLVIYNIPGLLEDDEDRVKKNVDILKKAFANKNGSIVFFVLTVESGRIRSCDCEAFKALSKAYEMKKENFTFIVNKWKSKTLAQAAVVHRVREMLADRDVEFIDELKGEFKEDVSIIRPILLSMILKRKPLEIKKTGELQLAAEELKAIKAELKKATQEYEKKIKENDEKFQREIARINEQLKEAQKSRLTFGRFVTGVVTLGTSEIVRAATKGKVRLDELVF